MTNSEGREPVSLLMSIRVDLAAGSNCLHCDYVRAT